MTPLVACAACGAATPADGAYCDQCGTPRDPTVQASSTGAPSLPDPLSSLPAPPPQEALEPEAVPVAQPEAKGDLRIATILFADVSGFTAMSETLEAEDVADIMNMVFDRLTDVIVGEGGTIDKYIGDCVMAIFGAPRSYGDDGERAVRAGLRMQVVLGELAEEIELASGTKLQMRIGLNTGQVRAGYVGGKGHGAYTVMGDAVNLANRLESACEKGRVLISAATARLVADSYVLSEAEELTVKGKKESVLASYVLRERALTLQDGQEFFEGIPVPLVGRTREVEVLDSTFRDVIAASETRTVVVKGPRGIGKSHLLETYLRELDPSTAHLAYGRESSTSSGLALGVLCRAMTRAVEGDYESVQAALTEFWHETKRPESVDAALWNSGSRLTADFFAGRRLFEDLTDDSVRAREETLIWGLGYLFSVLAGTRPVVLYIAGAQYLDPLTLRALREFAQLSPASSLGILILLEVTTESNQEIDTLEGFVEESGCNELVISPLSDAHIGELMDALLIRSTRRPAWLQSWLTQRSEGSPLYAMEFLSALCDVGVIKINDEESWQIASEAPAAGQLPDTIQSAFQARLDNLNPEARLLVARLSVLGDIFWDKVLFESLEGELDRDVAEETLLRLVSQGVLRRRAQSEISGCTSYRFESTYWREVAFDGLLHRERQHHHAKMARALQAFGVHESEPRLVAAQLHSAGLFPEASTLYVQAGRNLLRLGQREDLEELLTALNEVLETPAAEHGRRVAHFNDRYGFMH